MNIKNGDIITLNNGDVVEVTLKVLPKKIKKLIPGKQYELIYTDYFCNNYSKDGILFKLIPGYYTYVGRAVDNNRDIFYCASKGYVMFTIDNLNHVINER